MPKERESRRKLTILIDEELYARMIKVIPWGYQSKLVTLVLEDIVSAIEENPMFLPALHDQLLKPREASSSMKKAKEEADQKPKDVTPGES